MFKIPNWEDDVPKSKVDFGSTSKNKKQKKLTESIKSPQKSTNQLNHTTVVKSVKKNKKNKNNFSKNTNSGTQSKANGFDNLKRQGNNNTLKNKKKKPKQQQNTNASNQHQQKQSPAKNTVNTKPQLNGNGKLGHNSSNTNTLTDKPKKKRPKKRKFNSLESSTTNDTQTQESATEESIDISNPSRPKKKKHNDIDTSNMMPAKKKKNGIHTDDPEMDINTPQETKVDKKKEKIRKLLQVESNRNSINVSGQKLRDRMLERLKAAQFRFLNEKLYTSSGSDAQKLFQSDPDAFHTYHQGYQQQLKKWPVNPLDLIVKKISKMPKTHIIADMGCGEAALSKRVQQSVRSFDLVATAPGVEACDMAHTPLLSESVDVAVYCLALMGTELTQYLVEANRVLKVGGHLLIAEVESRFDKAETFAEGVQKLGFKLKDLDKRHQVFYFMEFTKLRAPPAKKSKLPALTLKPCLYKKR